jgi:catalase
MTIENSDPAWDKLVRETLTALDLDGGDKSRRPVHTTGIGATGYFTPSDVAGNYCNAEIFGADSVPVAIRFSNGSGLAVPHDGWNDVRGMAVKFHLGQDRQVDLLAMTLSEFFTATPESFLAFAQATPQVPVIRQTPWQQLWDMLRLIRPLPKPPAGQQKSAEGPAVAFADHHPDSRLAIFHASSLGAPISYARLAYHAVHTFVITAPDGTSRHVRFNWIPVAGVRIMPPFDAPQKGYLSQELTQRIANEPVKFLLMMVIGEMGDDFADPSRPWPPHRMQVCMGTLTINHVPDDQETHNEKLSFNPLRLCAGISTSEDPVLRMRLDVYELSRKRRNAPACPFAKES